MTQISTYATLVQALKDVAEDDNQEFADYIPTAIDLAEERLFRELDLMDLEKKQVGTLTTGVPAFPKPADYVITEYFSVTDITGRVVILKKRMEDYIREYWPNPANMDVPKYYADQDVSNFLIAPSPASNYAYVLRYSGKPPKLTTSNNSNYYSVNCQEQIYFACMVEMCKFMKAWQQGLVWEQEFTKARDSWNRHQERRRRDGSELPQNPDGGPNTIKHTENSAS